MQPWSVISFAQPATLSNLSSPAAVAAAIAIAFAQPLPGAKQERGPIAADTQLAQGKGGGGQGQGKGRRTRGHEE
jgi:hypothetical protein